MWLNWLKSKSLKHSSQISSLDLALACGVVNAHRFEKWLARVQDTVSNLFENLIFDQVGKTTTAVSDVGVHFRNEVIIGDLAVLGCGDKPHEVVDLIVFNTDFERSKTLPELFLRYNTISVNIKQLEGFLQVEILNVESSCNLVEGLVKPDHPEVLGLEPSTEVLKFNFSNAIRVSNSPQDPLVLNSQRQIEFIDEFLE